MHRLDLEEDIGNLAVRFPAVACVFIEHGIDFCCSGPRSAVQALRDHHLDKGPILRDILSFPEFDLRNGPPDNSPRATIAFIEQRFFHSLGRKLSAIEALLHKIVFFHGNEKNRGYRQLKKAFHTFAGGKWEHRREKEQILYPAILSSNPHRTDAACRALERNNRIMTTVINEICELQSKLALSEGGCIAVCALGMSLTALFNDCMEEMRLEKCFLDRTPKAASQPL